MVTTKIMKTNSFITICVLTLTLFVSGYQSTSFAASYQGYRSKPVDRNSFWYRNLHRRIHPPRKRKKVLLVGIDGLQYEKIAEVSTPNLDKLKIVKAYTGGIDDTASEQPTNSGPGWTTILTGVWVEMHGVRSNSSSNRSSATSVFSFIKHWKPSLKTASVVSWSPIHKFFQKQLQFIDYKLDSGGDANTVAKAVNHINNVGPDFIFVHLDNVDVIGHRHGFRDGWVLGRHSGFSNSNIGPYKVAIKNADSQLGQIIRAVENRIRTRNEDWLMIVTTDHGRGSGGYNHGGQTTQERTIFVAMNKLGNAAFTPNVAQTSVVPTILAHLGLLSSRWSGLRFPSSPLIGPQLKPSYMPPRKQTKKKSKSSGKRRACTGFVMC